MGLYSTVRESASFSSVPNANQFVQNQMDGTETSAVIKQSL